MKREQNHVVFNNTHHDYITWDKGLDVLCMIKKRRMVSWKRSIRGTKSTEGVTKQGTKSWSVRQKGIQEE